MSPVTTISRGENADVIVYRWQRTSVLTLGSAQLCRCSRNVSIQYCSSRRLTGSSKGVRRDSRTCASFDSRGVRSPQCAARDLRERELPLVHAVRGSELIPVGVYELVSDDGDLAEERLARRELPRHAGDERPIGDRRYGRYSSAIPRHSRKCHSGDRRVHFLPGFICLVNPARMGPEPIAVPSAHTSRRGGPLSWIGSSSSVFLLCGGGCRCGSCRASVCPRERCRTHAGRRGRTTVCNTTAGRHRDRADRRGAESCDSFQKPKPRPFELISTRNWKGTS